LISLPFEYSDIMMGGYVKNKGSEPFFIVIIKPVNIKIEEAANLLCRSTTSMPIISNCYGTQEGFLIQIQGSLDFVESFSYAYTNYFSVKPLVEIIEPNSNKGSGIIYNDSDTPDGYLRFKKDNYSFLYPNSWEIEEKSHGTIVICNHESNRFLNLEIRFS
jgi:hypothetical protein